MYLLFAVAYLCIAWDIPPLIPASIISSMSVLVSNSSFTCVFFKHACQANPGKDKKCAGSANNKVSD